MPTVDSIARQVDLTADVSSKFFRTNFDAAAKSTLITGPINTAADMVNSSFGLRSNISEMLGDYAEQRESFNAELDKTLSSLKESADKFKENAQADEEQKAAVRAKAQESELARRKSAQTFADDARERLQENEQTRQEQAEQIAAVTRERMQNATRNAREDTEPVAVAARERVEENEQTLTARTEQLADATRQRRQETAQAQREDTEPVAVAARERMEEDTRQLEQLDATRTENRNAARRTLRTQRETTERFAQEYLVSENANRQTRNDTLQSLNQTRDENTNAALSNVRNLVDRFNDAVNYLNENRGMSDRMSALAVTFDTAGRFAESLNDVGIVNDGGRLRVNESRLAEALNSNSSGVADALGQNGLAGRLDRSVELANSQRDNLFPSITDYINDRRNDPTESLYAAQLNQTAALSRVQGANFVNMFT